MVSFKSFPLADKDTPWSFTAADGNAILDRGGWALYKQVHTWYDDSEDNTPETKDAYKLPHHKIIDGDVKTVWRGVTAAMARLMQEATQIPDSDRSSCRNHLGRHYEEFGEEMPMMGEGHTVALEYLLSQGFSEEEAELVLSPATGTQRIFGEPTPSQLAKINALAKRPLAKEEAFTFTSKMIGDMIIPDRFVQIHKSLLDVFKKDAQSGVAFLLDHPWAGFGRPKAAYPYGRSFDARLTKGDVEGEQWALYGDFYIVRGREKDGISTDSIIQDILDGVLFDTSVGWGADTFECSVCGNDLRDIATCPHWPGQTYDGTLCYAIAKPPGFLMENSGVFDGAYPTAGILSHGEVINAMTPVLSLKQVPPEITLYNVYSSTKQRLTVLARRADLEKKVIMTVPELKGGEKVEGFISKEKAIEFLGKEYPAETVLKFAKEGIQYREELIQDTIEWGIRTNGNDFPVDAWKQLLGEPDRTIEAIKDFREQFKKQAMAAIPDGRKTDPEAGKPQQKQPGIPDDLFRTGVAASAPKVAALR